MSNVSIKKSKRGRPPVDTMAVTVRMHKSDLAKIDAWIAERHDENISRPEVIRRLVQLALSD
jgi:Arc/MetJ-type ribon-helix-helix transcriptional regulator